MSSRHLPFLPTGAPGAPGEPFITRSGSFLTIHWTSGDPGRAPITRYVIEARPSGWNLHHHHHFHQSGVSCRELPLQLLCRRLCRCQFNGLLIGVWFQCD